MRIVYCFQADKWKGWKQNFRQNLHQQLCLLFQNLANVIEKVFTIFNEGFSGIKTNKLFANCNLKKLKKINLQTTWRKKFYREFASGDKGASSKSKLESVKWNRCWWMSLWWKNNTKGMTWKIQKHKFRSKKKKCHTNTRLWCWVRP